MSIEFPLREKLTFFGRVSDPTIPVTIQTRMGIRTYMFLVDMDADCAVAPRHLAQQVGLVWPSLPPAQVVGVGQGGVSTRVGLLTLTDRLASYRVNSDTGDLTPLETYPVGKRPTWVLMTHLGG